MDTSLFWACRSLRELLACLLVCKEFKLSKIPSMWIPQMHEISFHGALWCFSTTTRWQVTPALICFVAESSGTPLHLGLHGINTAGCLRRWPQNPCWHNFPADGRSFPILTMTNREVTTTAGCSKKKNVVTLADRHCIQLGLQAVLSDAVAAQLGNHPLPPPAIPGVFHCTGTFNQ